MAGAMVRITSEIALLIKEFYYSGKSDIAIAKMYGITNKKVIDIAEGRFVPKIDDVDLVRARFCRYCSAPVGARELYCKDHKDKKNRIEFDDGAISGVVRTASTKTTPPKVDY